MSQLRSSNGAGEEKSSSELRRSPSPSLLHRISATFSPSFGPTPTLRRQLATPLPAVGEERPASSKSNESQVTIRASAGRRSSVSGRKVRASTTCTQPPLPRRGSAQMRPGGFGARSYHGVKSMIEDSLRGSSRLQSLKHQLGDNELVAESLDMRVAHIRKSTSGEEDTAHKYREQLLFICGCLSLARDFQEYQRRCDSRQREQKIDGNIPILAGTAAGHHDQQLPDFVASQAPVGQQERADLEAAVLLGIKVRVVDAIGSSLSLGKGLGLLCAFERQSILSLPTKALPHIRRILMDDPTTANRVRAFSAAIGPWWTAQCEQYQARYSSVVGDHPRRSLEAWNTTKQSTVTTTKISFTPDLEDTDAASTASTALNPTPSPNSDNDFAISRKSVPSRPLGTVAKTNPSVKEITKTFENSALSQHSTPSSTALEAFTPWPCVKELTETIGESLATDELPPPPIRSTPLPPFRSPPPAPTTLFAHPTGRSTPSPIPPCPDLIQSSVSAPSTRCSSRTSTRASRSSSRSPNCSPIPEDTADESGFSPITNSESGFSPKSASIPGFTAVINNACPSTEPEVLSPTDTDCTTDSEFSPVTPLTPNTLHRKRSTLRSDDPLTFSARRRGLLVSHYTMETLQAESEEHAYKVIPEMESHEINISAKPVANDPFVEQDPFDSDFCLSRPSSRLSNRSPISPNTTTIWPRSSSPCHGRLLGSIDNTRAQSPFLLSPMTYSRTPSRCPTPIPATPSRASRTQSRSSSPTPPQHLAPAIPIESKPTFVPILAPPKPPPKDRHLQPAASCANLRSSGLQSKLKPTLRSTFSTQSIHSRSSSMPTPSTSGSSRSHHPSLHETFRPSSSQGPMVPPKPAMTPSNHIASQFLTFTDPSTWVADAAAHKPYKLPVSRKMLLARAADATVGFEGIQGQITGPDADVEAQIDELLTGLQRQMADVDASRLLRKGKRGNKGARSGGVKNGVYPIVSRMGLAGYGCGGLESVSEEKSDCVGGGNGGDVKVVEWENY